VRDVISVVSQRTHLFNATVRENLALARPDAGEDEIIQVARQAHIDDFIRSLPQGYDTWIGEGGLKLSGGERQRIAIARALLKDAPILILDEATANLDAITEQKIMDELDALMRGLTTLIITHRLVGLETVDEILVLRQGRVVERGRHHELVQMEGLYHRLWTLQSQALA
jgi:ATP-binding cassette subfamily C protein CydC